MSCHSGSKRASCGQACLPNRKILICWTTVTHVLDVLVWGALEVVFMRARWWWVMRGAHGGAGALVGGPLRRAQAKPFVNLLVI